MNNSKPTDHRTTRVFCGILLCLIAVLFLSTADGQIATGGAYSLNQALIANGGGTSTATGYTVDGASGEPAAGAVPAGGPYTIRSGFWTLTPFAPTAANVTVGGRVIQSNGTGLPFVRVVLSGAPLTAPRITFTSSLGYFTFDEVVAGEIYIISVSSGRYGFGEDTQVVSVVDNVNDIVFISTWQN